MIRRAELDRIAPVLATLSPEQCRAIEAMTSTLINKLLHTPMVRLKEMLVAHPERDPSDVLCDLFTHEEAVR